MFEQNRIIDKGKRFDDNRWHGNKSAKETTARSTKSISMNKERVPTDSTTKTYNDMVPKLLPRA